MKRKALYLFSLILCLLIACTLLSAKIQEEMATLVQIDVRNAVGSFDPTSQSTQVLFRDGQGDHLYQVVDGVGWDPGLRIREIPAGVWELAYARNIYVKVPGGENYRFITSASRQPPDGRLAQIVEEFVQAPDQYLLLYAGEVPEPLELPEGAALAARSGQALLLDMDTAQLPFFDHKVRQQSTLLAAAGRIFSLTEAAQFLNQLPGLAAAALLLAVLLILWAQSCLLSSRLQGPKLLLWFHGLLMAASLWGLHRVLGAIDLPASLLPAENILDWQHYRETFSLLLGALESFPGQPHSLLALKAQVTAEAAGILGRGLPVCAGLMGAEWLLLWIPSLRPRRKRRYQGKYLAKKKG